MKTPDLVTYISDSGDGHHSDFDRLFMAASKDLVIKLDQVERPSDAKDQRAPMFYAMFDRAPRQTVASLARAVWRALRGLKTVGLFFRPGDCFIRGSLKYAVRKYAFACVSRLPGVSLLSIVPFELMPDVAKVATGWIYDPQLWDIPYLGKPRLDDLKKLGDLLTEKAQGRRIVIVLGGQHRSKGFDFFVDLWCASPDIRAAFLFVAAGKVASASRGKAQSFAEAGGFLIDRRIDDSELFYFYDRAAAIWACYAPDYNQSSGIYGRAVQMGLPVIARQGSLVEKFSLSLSHPTLALPFGEIGAAANLLQKWYPAVVAPEICAARVETMRAHSLAVLTRALIP